MSPPAASTSLAALPVAVLDFETTGLHARQGDAVIEVGVVHVDGDAVREEPALTCLVDPRRPIDPAARAVHGIAGADLAGSPTFPAIADELLASLRGRVIAGQNVGFDLSFLREELTRAGRPTPRLPALDTVLLARAVKPGHRPGYGLEQIARFLDVSWDGLRPHRALDDALMTARVMVELLRRLRERGDRSLADVLRRCASLALSGGRGHHEVPAGLIEAVLDSLDDGRALRIRYVSPGRPAPGQIQVAVETRRVVEPVALRGLWMDAFCRLRGAMRTFRLDRIHEFEMDG